MVQGVLQGKPPLLVSLWSGRTGLSALPEVHGAGVHRSSEWAQ